MLASGIWLLPNDATRGVGVPLLPAAPAAPGVPLAHGATPAGLHTQPGPGVGVVIAFTKSSSCFLPSPASVARSLTDRSWNPSNIMNRRVGSRSGAPAGEVKKSRCGAVIEVRPSRSRTLKLYEYSPSGSSW